MHGYATPVRNQEEQGDKTCRKVAQLAYIEGKEIKETTEFCRIGNTGRWVPS